MGQRQMLEELAAYKDETPISEDFLIRNGFKHITEYRRNDYAYYTENVTITIYPVKGNRWCVYISVLTNSELSETICICTVGQLRMFFAIEGLENIAKQLKS